MKTAHFWQDMPKEECHLPAPIGLLLRFFTLSVIKLQIPLSAKVAGFGSYQVQLLLVQSLSQGMTRGGVNTSASVATSLGAGVPCVKPVTPV